MNEKVVNIQIDATVAGRKLAVQEAQISLGINSIPSIELSCAPAVRTTLEPLNPYVYSPTVYNWSTLYEFLATRAEGLNETCDVDIIISGDENDRISLKNWILSGVGLTAAGATRAPYMSVVLQHPICKLTKVGAIYESLKFSIDDMISSSVASSENFLDVVSKTYEEERKAEYWPLDKNASAASEFRKNLGVGEFDPKKYLKFNGDNGIFLAGTNTKLRPSMAKAIGAMLHKNVGGSSTWDMLVSSQGTLLLNIVQDQKNNYTRDSLVIEPMQPWKAATITINDDRCNSTEVPGMDPLKIVGVMSTKLGVYADPINLGFRDRNGNPYDKKEAVVCEYMYTPQGVTLSMADGRVMKTQPPALLQSAFWKDGDAGQAITTCEGAANKSVQDGYNDILEKYCKAVYELTVASMKNARTSMALSLHDKEGKLILPGNTCKFTSGGRPLFFGYIRNVVHHMSTSGSNSTVVAMSYVRHTEDFKIGNKTVIKAGSPNAAYT